MSHGSDIVERGGMSSLLIAVLTVSAAAAAFTFLRRRRSLPPLPAAIRSPRRYFSAFKTAAQEVDDMKMRQGWENEGGAIQTNAPPKADQREKDAQQIA